MSLAVSAGKVADMSATCRRHVGPTAKSRHFWPTRPSRADTNSFPTLFLCRGLPTFFKFSLSTRGTYGVIIVQTGMYVLNNPFSQVTFLHPSHNIIMVTATADDVDDTTTTMATARRTVKAIWIQSQYAYNCDAQGVCYVTLLKSYIMFYICRDC